MPVRKIPKNYLGVTGSFASLKNGRMLGFESLLERDYMILLEFDDTVEKFEEQPVKVPGIKGTSPYVPDLLIHYKPSSKGKRVVLAEVKHTTDLAKNQEKYAPKFERARVYAEARNWEFEIITERECRPARLPTLKFLREYLHFDPEPSQVDQIMSTLEDAGGEMELNLLLNQLCSTDMEQLTLVPVVWNLVATKQIMIDFDQPVDDKTLLSLPLPEY
jgi:hypothetical protein